MSLNECKGSIDRTQINTNPKNGVQIEARLFRSMSRLHLVILEGDHQGPNAAKPFRRNNDDDDDVVDESPYVYRVNDNKII